MEEVDTRPTQAQGGIGFLEGANEGFERGKGLVGSGVKRARDDGFAEAGVIAEGREQFGVALELLLLAGEKLATAEEKFGAQQADALCASLSGGARSCSVTHVGENLHGDAVGRRAGAGEPARGVLVAT